MDYEIDSGTLVLHYQPRVSLRDWKAKSVEALVRHYVPGYGLLGPEAFVAEAERSGEIVRIGRWVLEAGWLRRRAGRGRAAQSQWR